MNPRSSPPERSAATAHATQTQASHPARDEALWELVFSRINLSRALRRVEANGGAAGIDGMTTQQLRSHLTEHWPSIRRRLDEGTYRPAPVRRVTIPKRSGGMRELGVPTVLDRFIQQALLQVLQPLFDPTFSESSFGFRPGKSAHMAVNAAKAHIESRRFVVDVDLEAFFDRVNHDVLMSRVARKVSDKRVLRLIGSYLRAGVLSEGVKVATEEGTPQGSPISPLLANVLLDDLDRELERRGHVFVRYADDIRVYVATERAGARVLESLSRFVEDRLKLRVNETKSGVGRATVHGLLGFGFFWMTKGKLGVRVDKKAISAFKDRVRRLTSRSWGISMAMRIGALNKFVRGWCAYFALANTPGVFADLDKWLHRRLRQVRWKEWKKLRTKRRNLTALGIRADVARQWAATRKGSWRIAGSAPLNRALPTSYWSQLGLVTVTEAATRLWDVWRTAGCGPACPVVWEGPG